MTLELHRGDYTISDDPARIQIDVVHGYVSRSYWATGVDRETVARSMAHSLCFGIYRGDEQIGFARLLTDYATFVYMMDVFVLEEHRGRGLAVWLVETMVAHPAVRDVPRWRLATKDAHTLYEKVGFGPLAMPDRLMERIDPDWPKGAGSTQEGVPT